MPPRFFVPLPLTAGHNFGLPASAARHIQVLRLQPGALIRLFDGSGAEWSARVARMTRSEVDVVVDEPLPALPALACAVTLAVGMPANERMDSLVEKATELGVAVLQPLMCERSVLRLQGDRAAKKLAHWQAIAVAASEQCGRATVPSLAPVKLLPAWLAGLAQESNQDATEDEASWRGVLSLRDARAIRLALPGTPLPRRLTFLSGPEGGLAEAEEAAARSAGFAPISLGPRVLRADTAPLAAMAWIGQLASS